MDQAVTAGAATTAQLKQAVEAWCEHGHSRPLRSWLDRALDGEGVPRDLRVPEWLPCLEALNDARCARPERWPIAFDARIEGFVRAVLRFSRPDGQPVMGAPRAGASTALRVLAEWTARLSDPALATVTDWWSAAPARRSRRHAPPPLPAWSSGTRPLAALRADWSKPGGFVAIDHRDPAEACAVELFATGQSWLGPGWFSDGESVVASRPKLTLWHSDSSADLAEWSFRCGERKVIRTALVLRGRGLALLADQVQGGGPEASMGLGISEAVAAGRVEESRAIRLSARRTGPAVHILPIGLPRRPYSTDRGSFAYDDETGLVVRHALAGQRAWLPLLVSWDPIRNRKRAEWRVLTVAERMRACPPGAAFAARVSWGRDDSLLIYRSLAKPGLRSFLGHQTRARFLVGLVNRTGDVEPVVTIDA